MSAGWEIGDLAVCVDDGPCTCGGCHGVPSGLFIGNKYRVVAIYVEDLPAERSCLCLDVGVPADDWHKLPGFGAHRFRKIRPDEHEACEAEFIKLLKRSKVPETVK